MNQSIAPKKVAEGEEASLEQEFQTLSVSRLVKKHSAQTIHRLGQSLGINVTGMSSTSITSSIKTLLSNQDKSSDPGYQRFIGSAAAPLIDPTVGQFGIKCVYCGETVVEFQAGFNPRNPTNILGKAIPFHLWPFRFLGPDHKDPTELAAANREKPMCAFCERPIAIEGSGTRVLPRALINLTPPAETLNQNQ